jgi:hypothetical protein
MTAREILAMIDTTPDAHGECDTCHAAPVDLFEPAPPNCGDFAYCRECWRRRALYKLPIEAAAKLSHEAKR